MGNVMVGYKVSNLIAASSPQIVTSAAGFGCSGPMDVLIKALDPGIFIGNAEMVSNGLPANGYELTPDQEYRFVLHGDGLNVGTTSTTSVAYTVFVSPHIA